MYGIHLGKCYSTLTIISFLEVVMNFWLPHGTFGILEKIAVATLVQVCLRFCFLFAGGGRARKKEKVGEREVFVWMDDVHSNRWCGSYIVAVLLSIKGEFKLNSNLFTGWKCFGAMILKKLPDCLSAWVTRCYNHDDNQVNTAGSISIIKSISTVNTTNLHNTNQAAAFTFMQDSSMILSQSIDWSREHSDSWANNSSLICNISQSVKTLFWNRH